MLADIFFAVATPDPSMLTVDILLLGVFATFLVVWLIGHRKQALRNHAFSLPPWAITIGSLCVVINLLFQLRGL